MNQPRFFSMLFFATTTLFLISCGGGGGGEKSSTDTSTATTTDTSTATMAKTETNTIVTTPQNMMVARHKVANFEKWKMSYDAHDSLRLASGIHSYVIGRGEHDSNMVLVAVKIDDLAKAKAFAKSASLKQAMQKGGVVGAPIIKFFTMVFRDTSTNSSRLRAVSYFKVKDWDAWQKSFDSTRQLKTDNGLMPRAYGYDPDDHHNATLVAAVLDTAKAHAFWNSDLLKQRRAASGVIGTPERFVFRVVQQY
jgi:hypothetical protein